MAAKSESLVDVMGGQDEDIAAILLGFLPQIDGIEFYCSATRSFSDKIEVRVAARSIAFAVAEIDFAELPIEGLAATTRTLVRSAIAVLREIADGASEKVSP